jgi:hypothetical protein
MLVHRGFGTPIEQVSVQACGHAAALDLLLQVAATATPPATPGWAGQICDATVKAVRALGKDESATAATAAAEDSTLAH